MCMYLLLGTWYPHLFSLCLQSWITLISSFFTHHREKIEKATEWLQLGWHNKSKEEEKMGTSSCRLLFFETCIKIILHNLCNVISWLYYFLNKPLIYYDTVIHGTAHMKHSSQEKILFVFTRIIYIPSHLSWKIYCLLRTFSVDQPVLFSTTGHVFYPLHCYRRQKEYHVVFANHLSLSHTQQCLSLTTIAIYCIPAKKRYIQPYLSVQCISSGWVRSETRASKNVCLSLHVV